MKHESEILFLESLKKSIERGIEGAIQALRSTEPTDADRIDALEKRMGEQQVAIVWLTNNVFYGRSPGRPDIVNRILSGEHSTDGR